MAETMNLQAQQKAMQALKDKLAAGEITRAECEKARAPIRGAVLRKNGFVETTK